MLFASGSSSAWHNSNVRNQHMNRVGVSIAIAIIAGFGAVYLLPPPWLEQLVTADAVCVAIFAIISTLTNKKSTT